MKVMRFKEVCLIFVALIFLSACSFSKNQDEKTEQDYSNLQSCFEGINGCAVIFDKQSDKHYFYNESLARDRVSPYSTFKMMSTLIGLKHGVIKDEQSKMNYNGTKYSVDVWNENLSLEQAFKSSCVWYFRQVIDKVMQVYGKDEVKSELQAVGYGNCDISEWNGSNVNSSPELNGFWLDSSLKISPVEQINVLYKIFEGQSNYTASQISVLKNIMFVSDDANGKIYGKTGSGSDGKAWFVGFKETGDKRKYFAIYLDDSDNKEKVNGQKAKEIALRIMSVN